MNPVEGMSEMLGIRIDHLGIAVKSIAPARAFYEALELQVIHEEIVGQECVKTVMLPLGESRIEMLEPTQEDAASAGGVLLEIVQPAVTDEGGH